MDLKGENMTEPEVSLYIALFHIKNIKLKFFLIKNNGSVIKI